MVKCTCYYRDYWKYWLTGADKAHAPSPSDSGNSQFHHPLTSRPYFRQLLAIKKKKKKDAGNFPGYQQVNFQSGILPANSVNILCPAELVLEMLRQIPKTSDSYLRMAELRLS